MGNHLRSLLVCKDAATVQLLEVSEQLRQRYLAQSQACPLPFLIKALEINNQCDIDYRSANNKRLHLEIALLKMCALCSNALAMPTQQAQPVQMPQNRPAQQPITPVQGQTRGSAPTPTAPTQQTIQQPTSAVTTSHDPLPATHNPNPVQPSPQPTHNPTIQQPTVQQPQPTVRPRGTTSSISINKAMQQAEQKAEEKEETWDSAFTQEQLTASWTDFVNRYKIISPNFAAALVKYTPKLANGNEIHFSVDNMLFERDTEGMGALRNHLKNSLHNNQYKLVPELMERPAEIEAYTDKDKFEKMAEERPFLRTLQTELKLEGDL